MESRINKGMANPFEQIRANSSDQRTSMDWYQREVRKIASGIIINVKIFIWKIALKCVFVNVIYTELVLKYLSYFY